SATKPKKAETTDTLGPKPNFSTMYGYNAPMMSATRSPTATDRSVNSRMWAGFCGPFVDMRRIVCGSSAASGDLFGQLAGDAHAPFNQPGNGRFVTRQAVTSRQQPALARRSLGEGGRRRNHVAFKEP